MDQILHNPDLILVYNVSMLQSIQQFSHWLLKGCGNELRLGYVCQQGVFVSRVFSEITCQALGFTKPWLEGSF